MKILISMGPYEPLCKVKEEETLRSRRELDLMHAMFSVKQPKVENDRAKMKIFTCYRGLNTA